MKDFLYCLVSLEGRVSFSAILKICDIISEWSKFFEVYKPGGLNSDMVSERGKTVHKRSHTTSDSSVRMELWLGVLCKSGSSVEPSVSMVALDNHSSTSTTSIQHQTIVDTVNDSRHSKR